jgi:hypothetical protein
MMHANNLFLCCVVFIFDFGCECGGGSMILMWLFVWNKE